jgi:aspartate/methionine/tyrosine aminotransferase
MRTASDFISARAHGVDASGIRRVFDLAAKMADPVNLSIGLPDFDVPDSIKEVAIESIRSGKNRYTPTQGIEPLRTKLRQHLSAEFHHDVGDVLITSGVSGGLMLAMMATVNPGDEVIFLDPYFVVYKHILTLIGGDPVPVDSYHNFRFDAKKVEAAITPRTRVLLLNSPNNPTGIVMTDAEVAAAIDIARRHDLLIVTDEIYVPFMYDLPPGVPLPSPFGKYENTLLLRGFSKSHAMTGWRLGYAAGPAAIIAQMTKLQQYTYVCAPSPLQYAAAAAMDFSVAPAVADYAVKRSIVCEGLDPAFQVGKPAGAFYVFPAAPGGDATAFAERAIAANVLVIPGGVFSSKNTHFRLSYATTNDKLREGVRILNSLV